MTSHVASAAAVVGVAVLGLMELGAETINLSTGLDASDSLILSCGVDDAHWTVEQTNGITPATTVSPSCTNWWSGWAPNGPHSTWIARNTAWVQGPAGYSFHRRFDLTQYDLSSVSITGSWNIDDAGSLKINGIEIARLPWCLDLGRLHPFTVPTQYLNQGENILSITMDACNEFVDAVRLEAVVQGAAPRYRARWFTIDDGGRESSTGGPYRLSVTIGQPDAGAVPAGGNYVVTGGFWVTPRRTCPTLIRVDFDSDCDVDLFDGQAFDACASGPGIAHSGLPACARADFDGDGDVDQSDFGRFQACYSGAGRPANLHCAD